MFNLLRRHTDEFRLNLYDSLIHSFTAELIGEISQPFAGLISQKQPNLYHIY